MTRKRKQKIAMLLADIIRNCETADKISPEAFGKIVDDAFDISFEVGSFPMMSAVMIRVKKLRKEELDLRKIKFEGGEQ